MRICILLLVGASFFPFSAWAGEQKPKQEYVEFSRLVHSIAVKQLPKQFEENSAWGKRTEIPPNLKLMKLRSVVRVGDKLEAPHGPWFRATGKVEDPNKNLKIVIKDFKKLDATTYRVVADVDVTILCYGEWQQWQKGLLLVGADATADANITANVVCDVAVSLNLAKLPPELKLEPKVTELSLNLVEFKLRGDPIIKGERGDALRDNLKELLRTIVKASEGMVKDQANAAIVEALKEGKGSISAGAIMKTLPMPK
jgi:hypothetical protein